ncbi:MAG: squalene/phytoene synthase family protein [Rhodospirillales bacterium]|nr:squalene/phytoene synthase family protein [Rhodospirillales bacterium]
MKNAFDYCIELVRDRDRDRYWCAMLAPAAYRNDLFALYAFNAEIAEIGISVSEPLIGQMRLRWWLDVLPGIYAGSPPQQPVAVALSQTVGRRPLAQQRIEQFLEARQRDLDPAPPPHMRALLAYADATSGALLELSLAVMDKTDPASLHAAHHLGIAWMLTGLIRSIPHQLQRGRSQLPTDLCAKHGFNRQALHDHGYQGKPPPGFIEVVADLKAEIFDNLARAGSTPEAAAYASPLLLKRLAQGYMDELTRVNNDPFQLNHQRRGPRLRDMIRITWASLIASS